MTDFRTSDRDVNRAIRSWLHEDRHEDVSRVAGAVLDLAETTPQRRATWWPARRTPAMNKFVTIGLGAAAVVVLAIVLVNVLPGSGLGIGDEPSAEPTPTAQPSVAGPSSSAEAFLPEGPLLVWDPLAADPPIEDAATITMTISADGWTYHPDFQALFKGDEVDNMSEAVVIPGSNSPGTGFYVYGDPCQWQSTTPETPATTVDEIIGALAGQADRDASEPVEVTVDGYSGMMITLHVPDDASFDQCDGGEFASYELEGLGDGPTHWHQGPSQIDDFWFVDVEGTIVDVRASYRPDTPPELVDEMRSIIESATFEFP